jgi:hypothetical protein
VGCPTPHPKVAGNSPDPAYIVVTGDNNDGGGLADVVEVGTSLNELGDGAPLGKVA